jgi:protein-S-isoprenylcysteine O-methyltransferase Ste14
MDALTRRAWTGVATFVIALAVLIFLPAWSLAFRQGWAYWLVFTGAVAWITVYFLRHDRQLIARRLTAGPAAEHERSQQRIQATASMMLCLTFVIAGVDHHFRWSPTVNAGLEAAAVALVMVGFYLIFLAFRENSHASSIIEVAEGQTVISTGPYSVVRHPMYAGAVLLFAATPLALGSWWAFIPAAGLCAALAARILDEERYLANHLPGYAEYCRRVRARVVPGVW